MNYEQLHNLIYIPYRDAPHAYEAAKKGLKYGAYGIASVYGVSLLPRAAMAYVAVSDSIVLSNTSISTGIFVENTMNAGINAGMCAARQTVATGVVASGSPFIQNNMSNILDFTSSLFPGPPSPNLSGFFGWSASQLSPTPPEEALR